MIFSIGNHIEQIKAGTKTQTRRPTGRYRVGETYAIQPGRGKKAIPEGRILITHMWIEGHWEKIHPIDAEAEGGYSVEEYEELYSKMYPEWAGRWCYEFKYVPSDTLP